MESNKVLRELLELFVRINNKYNNFDKKTYDYGSGIVLYPSETHMMTAIKKYSESNITELGSKLGITKSAASQVIIKLSKKGFVEKYKSLDNEKNILIKLTPEGEKAYTKFEEARNNIFSELMNELESLTDKERELVKHMFVSIDKHLDKKLGLH